MGKRGRIYLAAVVAAAVIAGLGVWKMAQFPPDTTPEGAYLRIAAAIARDDVRGCFAYLQEEAQHAAFSIGDYTNKSKARIAAAYPEEVKAKTLPRYASLAGAKDGADVWAKVAKDRGYLGRLRRDLSGVKQIETVGERATITTARGTRYSFRRRPNGIWGLTLFTAELESEAQRMARDWEKIDQAAADYERERKR